MRKIVTFIFGCFCIFSSQMLFAAYEGISIEQIGKTDN